jgi:hypothetical protein
MQNKAKVSEVEPTRFQPINSLVQLLAAKKNPNRLAHDRRFVYLIHLRMSRGER